MYQLDKQLSLLTKLTLENDKATDLLCLYLIDSKNNEDLTKFLLLAAQHGVQQVVVDHLITYCNKKDISIPTQVKKAHIWWSLFQFHKRSEQIWLQQLEKGLADCGIRAVRLKGLSYIHYIYKDSALRHSSDTDLLIQSQDLLEAERIFRACAADAGLQVMSSLEDKQVGGYINEDNSHYACFTAYSAENKQRYTVEFHKDVEFLSPMRLRPVYENAILTDGHWLTSPLDTLLVACNHAWNHFPYSFHNFYYHPAILRLYMDVLEAYRAVRALGFSDDDLWKRACVCGAQDVVGNAFRWTNLVYAAPYEKTEESPEVVLPDFTHNAFHVYPCDLCSPHLTSRFVDQLFGRDRERARVIGQYEVWMRDHAEVPSTLTVDNQFHHDGFFDRFLTRSFCFNAPKVSSTLHIHREAEVLRFVIHVSGLFSRASSATDQLDGNVSYITFAFLGEQFRAFHLQMGASGLYVLRQTQKDGKFLPFSQVELTCEKVDEAAFRIEWRLPLTFLPSEREVCFDYQLHWRGESREQVQDMSWGAAVLGGTFFDMLEDCKCFLPKITVC